MAPEVADRVLWLEDGAFRQLADLVIDPVCGMSVDPGTAVAVDVGGGRHWLCTPYCRDELLADPDRFLAAEHSST
jgi:putative ABC transport system ATP-binding protein